MALSSNTLFHFTRELKTLKLILGGLNFWPRFSVEKGWNLEFAVSMVCFSDIPLSKITNHMDFYGSYGLGLSKDWAIDNGNIAPVLYVTSKKGLQRLAPLVKNDKDKTPTLLSMMKPYQSWNTDKFGKRRRNYLYYDEREWRYIPVEALTPQQYCYRVEKEHKVTDLENEVSNTKEARLHFSVKDIRYLFIEKEEERAELIDFIDKLPMNVIADIDKPILKSKILTRVQINNDF